MVYCAVVGCSNNNNKKSKNYSSNYRYFSFPTANKEVCKLWVQKCYQKHMFKIENARICSDHFSDEAFCDKEKLLQLPRNKWKLKENAIPSLNLAKAETANKKNRDERTKKRNIAKNIEDIDIHEIGSNVVEQPTNETERGQPPENTDSRKKIGTEIKMSTVTTQNVLFNELCRACLRKSNNMRYLMNTSDDTIKTLLTQFSAFLNKELQFSRIYPCYLCANCELQLRASLDFRALCLKSDQFITSILEQTNLIQTRFVIKDENGASELSEGNKKPIQNQEVVAYQVKDENDHPVKGQISQKIDKQPLNSSIEHIEVVQDDTDDEDSETYLNIDPFEKLELVEEDVERDVEPQKLSNQSYKSKSPIRKHIRRAIRLENQHPWQTKWAKKSVKNRQSANDIMQLVGRLKLVRYPKEDVQAIIDSVEQKTAQEIECLFCNLICQGQRALCRHVGSAHRDKKDNWCSTCNEPVEDMSTHRIGGHKDQLTCPFCKKKLPSIGKFKAHLETHMMIENEYRCEKCDTLFQSERNLMIHTRRLHLTDVKYACDSCPQKYRSEVQLQLHRKIHYKQEHNECPDCLIKFETSEEIDRHVCTQQNKAFLESFDEKENFCKVCDRRVKSLEVHYKRWHDPDSIKEKKNKSTPVLYQNLCALCGKNYRTQGSLNLHMRRHTGDKPFKCNFCSMRMVSKSAIKNHERIHTGERPYICSYCGKGFKTNTTLSFHVQIHTGKRIQCPMCPKKFARRIEMRVHLHSHTGERPYQCDVCGQGFVQHCHLSQHRLKHTGERPYKCEICHKAYPHPNTLKKHVKIVHLGEKFLKCPFCSFECNQWIYLKRHKQAHHMGEVKEENL